MRRPCKSIVVATCLAIIFLVGPLSAATINCVQAISTTENGGTPPWGLYEKLPPGFTIDPHRGHSDIAPELAASYWPSGARPVDGSCSVALLRGPIEAGDYEVARKFVRQHLPFLETVLLHSPGGRVDEAIKIGRLLRRFLIDTIAPSHFRDNHLEYIKTKICQGPQCICASACALIWFGGPSREGRVGLHRPHFKDQAFARLPASEANKAYQAMIGAVTNYMTEMNVPGRSIDAMTTTPSNGLTWVEANEIGPDRGLSHDPSYYEWVLSSCPTTLNADEREKLIVPPSRTKPLDLNPALYTRWSEAIRCTQTLRHNNRDKLPKP